MISELAERRPPEVLSETNAERDKFNLTFDRSLHTFHKGSESA